MSLDDKFFENYITINRFKSKKNNVSLVKSQYTNNLYVLKEFSNKNAMDREIEILKRLKNKEVLVPSIEYFNGYKLFLEYIDGNTLLDEFQTAEEENIDFSYIIPDLIAWISKFYSVFKEKNIIIGDVNFRNFIIGKNILGLDFEDCRIGRYEEDAGRLCGYALSYSPEFTEWKFNFTKRLYNNLTQYLKLNSLLVKAEVLKQLHERNISEELIRIVNKRLTIE